METSKQLQIANQKELDLLTAKYNLLCKIITPAGFYKTWFNSLSIHKGYEEAFEALNAEYYAMVGEYRYSSYKAFKASLRKIK